MKLESTKSKHPQLIYEAKLYRILQGAVGKSKALNEGLARQTATSTSLHACDLAFTSMSPDCCSTVCFCDDGTTGVPYIRWYGVEVSTELR